MEGGECFGVGGRLSPGTSVLSKASLPWYAQNPLQGCRRFAGSHRAGMLVKTELKREVWVGGRG